MQGAACAYVSRKGSYNMGKEKKFSLLIFYNIWGGVNMLMQPMEVLP